MKKMATLIHSQEPEGDESWTFLFTPQACFRHLDTHKWGKGALDLWGGSFVVDLWSKVHSLHFYVYKTTGKKDIGFIILTEICISYLTF